MASHICGDHVVHIYPEVVRYPLYDEPNARGRLPEASAETWDNYILVNSEFPVDCAYEFVSPTDLICAGPETNCIIPWGFSDIGFNKAGTQALVYMYSDCSECGGGGSIYLVEKKDGSWVLINSWAMWVS